MYLINIYLIKLFVPKQSFRVGELLKFCCDDFWMMLHLFHIINCERYFPPCQKSVSKYNLEQKNFNIQHLHEKTVNHSVITAKSIGGRN